MNRYEAIAVHRPAKDGGLDRVVAFCRIDLPVIFLCAVLFTLFALVAVAASARFEAHYARIDMAVPGATMQLFWLRHHFWLLVVPWIFFVWGLCKLARAIPILACTGAVVTHGLAIAWAIVALLLPFHRHT